MIRISTERGIESVDDWEDITSRTGFTDDLDPDSIELKAVIASYIFPYRIPCGLRTCRQPHQRGYVIQSRDGRETNIGKDCGSIHFDLDFKKMSRQHDREVEDEERRERLETIKARTEILSDTVDEMMAGPPDAKLMYRRCCDLTDKLSTLPEGVVDLVRDMVRNRTPVITTQRETTEAEKDAMRSSGQTVQGYIEEQVGTLHGIECLFEENDLRKLVYREIAPVLDEIRAVDIPQLSRSELRDMVKRAEEIDARIERAQEVIQLGQRLLESGNLRQLKIATKTGAERKKFEQFIETCKKQGLN